MRPGNPESSYSPSSRWSCVYAACRFPCRPPRSTDHLSSLAICHSNSTCACSPTAGQQPTGHCDEPDRRVEEFATARFAYILRRLAAEGAAALRRYIAACTALCSLLLCDCMVSGSWKHHVMLRSQVLTKDEPSQWPKLSTNVQVRTRLQSQHLPIRHTCSTRRSCSVLTVGSSPQ